MSNTQSDGKIGFQHARVDRDEYMKHRPPYPQSFYDRLYDHHSRYSESFALVNDCGAGGGVASKELAKKFAKVIVSEPNEKYLNFAKSHLEPKFPQGKFEFLAEGGEKSSVKSESLDALTICEALHWCDIDVAMKEFHRQLKKGGTLCICHYSMPYVKEPGFNELWDKLLMQGFAKMRSGEMGELCLRAPKNLSCGYESIAFPEDLWESGAERIIINTNGDAAIYRGLYQPNGQLRI